MCWAGRREWEFYLELLAAFSLFEEGIFWGSVGSTQDESIG